MKRGKGFYIEETTTNSSVSPYHVATWLAQDSHRSLRATNSFKITTQSHCKVTLIMKNEYSRTQINITQNVYIKVKLSHHLKDVREIIGNIKSNKLRHRYIRHNIVYTCPSEKIHAYNLATIGKISTLFYL